MFKQGERKILFTSDVNVTIAISFYQITSKKKYFHGKTVVKVLCHSENGKRFYYHQGRKN